MGIVSIRGKDYPVPEDVEIAFRALALVNRQLGAQPSRADRRALRDNAFEAEGQLIRAIHRWVDSLLVPSIEPEDK